MCCKPSEIAIAKFFISERKAAPSLLHVDKDLAEPAAFALARTQIDFTPAKAARPQSEHLAASAEDVALVVDSESGGIDRA